MKKAVAILLTILMLFTLFQGALRENIAKAQGQPIRWKYDVSGGILFSPVVATDGTIYIIAGSFYTLYAINPNGTLKWKYEVEYKVCFAPTIGKDGTVYLRAKSPGEENYLLAIHDGTLKWKYKLGTGMSYSFQELDPPIFDEEGIIYIHTYENWFAINRDGTLHEKLYSEYPYSEKIITISKGIIYVNTPGAVRAIGPGNELKWAVKLNEKFNDVGIGFPFSIISYKDTIYILAENPWNSAAPDDIYLYAIGLDGKVKWKYKADDYWRITFYNKTFPVGPVVGNDGTVFVTFTSPSNYEPFSIIYAINPNGTLKWKYRFSFWVRIFGEDFTKSEANGILYFYVYNSDSGRHNLYALDQSGNLKWTFSIKESSFYLKFLGIKNNKAYIQTFEDTSHILLIEDGKLRGDVICPPGPIQIYNPTSYSCIGEDGTLYFTFSTMPSTLWAINFAIPEKKTLTIVLKIGNSNITINGKTKPIDEQGTKPIIKNGRTLLPIRAVIEALGGTVGWDATERKVTVSLGPTTIELWIGKSIAKVKGVNTPIDSTNNKVVPEIINSRTMLPLRFITENLGCNVQWDGTTQTITITYGG